MIPVTSTDCNDALAIDYLVSKRIILLESLTPDDLFGLRKEEVESIDTGCFPLFRKAFIFGKFKFGWAKPESPMYL